MAGRFVHRLLAIASLLVPIVFAADASAQNSQPFSFYAAVDSPGGLLSPVAVDLNGDGKLDLVGTASYSGLVVMLGNGDGSFQSPTYYGVPYGAYATAIQVGDMNGDGIPDLVATVKEGNSLYLNVFLGNGDGTFQAPIVTSLPTASQGNYTSLVLGDFNGDGKLDVATVGAPVPNSYTTGVAVLLGNGDGSFQTPVIYGTGVDAVNVKAGDFNGDGKLDLVTVDYPSGKVSVFLGNGDGTFQAAIVTSVGTLPNSGPFVVADLNRDGKLDVAVGSWVLLGKGDGSFQTPISLPINGADIEASGDFNGDGIPDVVAVLGATPNLFPPEAPVALILLGNGDGTFRQSDSFVVMESTIAVGDANGDGILDVITGDASVTFGNGDGTFQAQPEFANGESNDNSYFVLAADMNGDGKPDLVELYQTRYNQNQSYGVGVLFGTGGGGFSAPVLTNLTSGNGIDGNPGIAAGDFNGDGKMDLAVSQDNYFSVLLGNGDGTFRTPTNYAPAISSIAAADFNGDGKLDIVGIGPLGINVHLGIGNGTFGPAIVSGVNNAGVGELAIADFNGDGKLDLVVSGVPNVGYNSSAPLYLLLGNGDGTFATPVQLAPSSLGVTVGDFNGDGNPDIAFITQTDVEVLLGNGNGTFQSPLIIPAVVDSISAADFNGDGKLDLAAFIYIGNLSAASGVSILFGNGDGTFQPPTPPYGANLLGVEGTVNPYSTDLAIADFNGDGTLDAAAGTYNSTIALLFNRPSGSGVTVNPGTLNFGNQGVGTSSSAQAVSLTNVGQSALSISSISITGSESAEFSQANTCDGSVSAGKGCAISVKFTPSAAGVQTATLLITDNAKGSPQMVTLSGMGASLGLGVASGSSATATVSAGQTAQYKLSIGGMGMSGTATLSCSGAPTGASCSFPDGTSINVSATQATPFTVSVTTTSRTMARMLHDRSLPWPWLWGWAIAGIVLLPGTRKARARSARLLPLLLLLFLGACGGGSGSGSSSGSQPNPNGTPAGTYHLTVTATSGSTQEAMQLTLTVQ